MSVETTMPSGSAPQYDTLAPTFPRNSMSSHVAGNVATSSRTKPMSNATIIPTSAEDGGGGIPDPQGRVVDPRGRPVAGGSSWQPDPCHRLGGGLPVAGHRSTPGGRAGRARAAGTRGARLPGPNQGARLP